MGEEMETLVPAGTLSEDRPTDRAISSVLVAGLGKVGALVAELLGGAGYDVTGADRETVAGLSVATVSADFTSARDTERLLESVDAVVSCLPYQLARPLMEAAHGAGVHYLDLTEDRRASAMARSLSPSARAALIPHCGLAPGYICLVGAGLVQQFDAVHRLRLRVGALPQHATGPLGYSFTWSAAGVVNEYLNACEVLRDGQPAEVPGLAKNERVIIGGTELEAFTTSGGLGTMCETYRGVIRDLDYKSLRYPGHRDLMHFFLHDLGMQDRREEAARILSDAVPPVEEDVVFVYAAAEGMRDGQAASKEIAKAYYPKSVGGRTWRAISWTTAASVCSVVDLLAAGEIPARGFLRQEEIARSSFEATEFGRMFR